MLRRWSIWIAQYTTQMSKGKYRHLLRKRISWEKRQEALCYDDQIFCSKKINLGLFRKIKISALQDEGMLDARADSYLDGWWTETCFWKWKKCCSLGGTKSERQKIHPLCCTCSTKSCRKYHCKFVITVCMWIIASCSGGKIPLWGLNTVPLKTFVVIVCL